MPANRIVRFVKLMVDSRDIGEHLTLASDHRDDLTIHREINDSETSTIILWSSDKIQSEITIINEAISSIDDNLTELNLGKIRVLAGEPSEYIGNSLGDGLWVDPFGRVAISTTFSDAYYLKTSFINITAGIPSAGIPIVLDLDGYISNTFIRADLFDNYFSITDHISASVGVADAGKPVVTDIDGKIAASLLSLDAMTFMGEFTPIVGTEYPVSPTNGNFWRVVGVDASLGYTFATGDLIGLTAFVGDMMLYGTSGWVLADSAVDTNMYLLLDGSSAMAGNLRMANNKLTELSPGTDNLDAVNYGQLHLHDLNMMLQNWSKFDLTEEEIHHFGLWNSVLSKMCSCNSTLNLDISKVSISTDGINWSYWDIAVTKYFKFLSMITSVDDTLMVMIGSPERWLIGGTPYDGTLPPYNVATSTTGYNWAMTNSSQIGDAKLSALAYDSKNSLFCAVGRSNSHGVGQWQHISFTSPDGINWVTGVPFGPSSSSASIIGCAYSKDLHQFCALASTGSPMDNNKSFISSDGLNWAEHTVNIGDALSSIIYVDELDLFFACGGDGTGNYPIIASSSDGINWTVYSGPLDNGVLTTLVWVPEKQAIFCSGYVGNLPYVAYFDSVENILHGNIIPAPAKGKFVGRIMCQPVTSRVFASSEMANFYSFAV